MRLRFALALTTLFVAGTSRGQTPTLRAETQPQLDHLAPVALGEAIPANTIFKSPYPILFVHGLDSSDKTWKSTTDMLQAWWPGYHRLDYILNFSSSTRWQDDIAEFEPTSIGESTNLFAVNFHVSQEYGGTKWGRYGGTLWFGQSESNEASVTKQGAALGFAIRRILEATGARKVILVGHSMGGLAIREYLQRTENGLHKWWVEPDREDGHRVAKVVTTGTPHLGSATLQIGEAYSGEAGQTIPNTKSEGTRDLRYEYNGVAAPYLFGGREASVPSSYHNRDVNADGDENDVIVGINALQTTRDNPAMPLPTNLMYHWIVSSKCTALTFSLASAGTCLIQQEDGDGLVELDRMYLYSVSGNAITLLPAGRAIALNAEKNHSSQPGDWQTLLTALDEPESFQPGYSVPILRPEDPRVFLMAVQNEPAYLYDGIDEDEFRIDPPSAMPVTLTFVRNEAALFNASLEVWADGQMVASSPGLFTASNWASVTFTARAVPHFVKVRTPITTVSVNNFYTFRATSPNAVDASAIERTPGVSFSVAPNPARGASRMAFSLDRPGVVTADLVDALGRTLRTLADGALDAGDHAADIDVSGLAPGLYFVRLTSDGRTSTRPLAVVR